MNLYSLAMSTAFALLVMTAPTELHAQKLESGTWTGTSTDPMGQTQNITYTVSTTGDTLRISIGIPDGPTLAFANVHFEQGKLMFWVGLDQDRRITCALNPVDGGGYAGECTDSEGQHGQLSMIPPKKEGN